MRRFGGFAMTFPVVLAIVAAFGTPSASAAVTSIWLVNGKAVLTPVLALSELISIGVQEDMGIPAAVECSAGSIVGEGWVGPLTEGEITSVTFIEPSVHCKPTAKAENLKGELVANGCESLKSVAAIGLPWLTELMLVGSVYLDLILPGGKGTPGALFECKTLLGTIDDTCIDPSEGTSVDIDNTTEGDIIALSNKTRENESTENLTCTVGGKENGLAIGEALVEVMEGTLAVSETEEE